MKRVAVIQARMTSTRLPGKVLMEIAGRPLIAHQIRRLQACRLVDAIVIATTTNATDDPLVALAQREGVEWFRGDEQDVLGRYLGAARQAKAEIVIRLTSDCPLLDPAVTDQVIAALSEDEAGCDYASNVIARSYPRGLDVEAFWYDTLVRMDRLGRSPAAREHVTVFLRSERPDLFLRRDVVDAQDNSDLRWTVDTPADLTLIKRLYEELGLGERIAPYKEILAYVRANPDLIAINAEMTTWTPPTP